MARCRTGRDDSDHFIDTFYAIGVRDNKDDCVLYRADRMPPFLTDRDSLHKAQTERVFKHQLSGFEVDAVFRLVRFVFGRVPFEPLYLQFSIYKRLPGVSRVF